MADEQIIRSKHSLKKPMVMLYAWVVILLVTIVGSGFSRYYARDNYNSIPARAIDDILINKIDITKKDCDNIQSNLRNYKKVKKI